jgi:hypothetical protein
MLVEYPNRRAKSTEIYEDLDNIEKLTDNAAITYKVNYEHLN